MLPHSILSTLSIGFSAANHPRKNIQTRRCLYNAHATTRLPCTHAHTCTPRLPTSIYVHLCTTIYILKFLPLRRYAWQRVALLTTQPTRYLTPLSHTKVHLYWSDKHMHGFYAVGLYTPLHPSGNPGRGVGLNLIISVIASY